MDSRRGEIDDDVAGLKWELSYLVESETLRMDPINHRADEW